MSLNKQHKEQLAVELEKLINKSIDMSMFPYVKGKSVRIKHIIVRETNWGFLVFDTKENKEVAKTFCKTSALALARSVANVAQDTPISRCKDDILKLDHIIQKNYLDALFHRHTIKVTKCASKRFIAETRYDLAAEKTKSAKDQLDKYIY